MEAQVALEATAAITVSGFGFDVMPEWPVTSDEPWLITSGTSWQASSAGEWTAATRRSGWWGRVTECRSRTSCHRYGNGAERRQGSATRYDNALGVVQSVVHGP